MTAYYITPAIPYVNASPHLGHALEFAQADVLARHRRVRGHDVRLLSGTDDHALKNVLAARAAGVPIAEYVARAAAQLAPFCPEGAIRLAEQLGDHDRVAAPVPVFVRLT